MDTPIIRGHALPGLHLLRDFYILRETAAGRGECVQIAADERTVLCAYASFDTSDFRHTR
jgi:hypothetical protein